MLRATLILGAALAVLGMPGCGNAVPPTPIQEALGQLRLGNYDEAIAAASAAIAAHPSDPQPYAVRGRAHQYRNAQGDLQRAIDDFSKAIELEPKNPELFYSRSMAYRDSGDAEAAHEDRTTARQLDPQVAEMNSRASDIPIPSIDLTPPDPTPAEGPPREEINLRPRGASRESLRLKKQFEGKGTVGGRSSSFGADPQVDPQTLRQSTILDDPELAMPPAGKAADRDERSGRPATRGDLERRGAAASDRPTPPTPLIRNPFAGGGGTPWQPAKPVPAPQPTPPPSLNPFGQHVPRPTGRVEPPPAEELRPNR